MKICEKKDWSSDDWKALSDEAQLDAIAWHELQTERKLKYLQIMEDALPRDKKSNKINDPQSFFLIMLKRLELL